jgi:hypothetical protein
MTPLESAFAFAVLFAVLVGVGFPWVVDRGHGTPKRLTPTRTIAVALVTFVAAVAANRVALLVNQPWDPRWCCELSHWATHVAQALLTLPIAFGLYGLGGAWPATGWTERCLAAAQQLALGVVLGTFLAAAGAAIPSLWGEWRLDYVMAFVLHSVGEVLGFGSGLILLAVCLVMLVVGVRGALRPAAQPS